MNPVPSNPLENTIVALIGFAGTGKYTIGRELCERTGARLIHNHLINNPIFSVVNADGVTPLPAGVWDRVKEIREVVYQAIRELSPAEMSFVITTELRESNPLDHLAFQNLGRTCRGAAEPICPDSSDLRSGRTLPPRGRSGAHRHAQIDQP